MYPYRRRSCGRTLRGCDDLQSVRSNGQASLTVLNMISVPLFRIYYPILSEMTICTQSARQSSMIKRIDGKILRCPLLIVCNKIVLFLNKREEKKIKKQNVAIVNDGHRQHRSSNRVTAYIVENSSLTTRVPKQQQQQPTPFIKENKITLPRKVESHDNIHI